MVLPGRVWPVLSEEVTLEPRSKGQEPCALDTENKPGWQQERGGRVVGTGYLRSVLWR